MSAPRLAALALAAGLLAATGTHAATVPTGLIDELIVSGLSQPRAFAFLPDGRTLVVERLSGRIRMVVDHHIAAQDPLLTVGDLVIVGSEGGMQGIAVDPQWPLRPFVYVFYTRAGGVMALVRYSGSGDLWNAAGETLTLGSPVVLLADIPDAIDGHQGGGMRFGPDGMLYLGLGDDRTDCAAQDSTSLRGQVLRLRVSGLPSGDNGGLPIPRSLLVPPDNPLSSADSNAKLVFAYGLRNPWSLDIDAVDGRVIVADPGEEDEEELDELVPGGNYGWPWREGFAVLAALSCPEPGGSGSPANGFLPPIFSYVRDASGHAIICGGIYRPAFEGTANWPSTYDGDTFWGNYYVGELFRLKRDASTGAWRGAPRVPGQTDDAWGSGFVHASDFRVGIDGSLYWVQLSTGQLRRVRCTDPTVSAPPATPNELRLACGPNPFAAGTTLSFTLPAAGRARLELFDPLGRRVAVLLDGERPAGTTTLRWDGSTEEGRPLPAGVYLALLRAGGEQRALRIMRVR